MVVIHAAGVSTPRVRHRSPFFAQFYFENHQSVLGSRGPASSSAHTKTAIMAIHAEHALHGGRADADGAADLHLALCPRRAAGNAANGVPGEGRQFQLQSGQRRQRHCRTAFADTHASSTARRNSLHRSHGLAKALRSGIRLVESFLTDCPVPSRTSRNRLPADCRYGVTTGDRARDCPGLMARHRMRPLQFGSMIVGLSLPPTEIITEALIDPIFTRWSGSVRGSAG